MSATTDSSWAGDFLFVYRAEVLPLPERIPGRLPWTAYHDDY